MKHPNTCLRTNESIFRRALDGMKRRCRAGDSQRSVTTNFASTNFSYFTIKSTVSIIIDSTITQRHCHDHPPDHKRDYKYDDYLAIAILLILGLLPLVAQQ